MFFSGINFRASALGVRSYCDKHGYDHLFDGIRATLEGYDLAVANLESVLSQAEGSERRSLHAVLNRGSPVAAQAIRNAGIRLLTLANNHIFDYGPLASTIPSRRLKASGCGIAAALPGPSICTSMAAGTMPS